MLEQEPLHVHLIGTMDRLEVLVVARRRHHATQLLGARLHHHACDAPAVVAREVHDVGRVIGREPQRAHLLADADAAVVLHRARVVRAALGMPARGLAEIEHDAWHAVPVEEQRQHQPDGAAADDGDRGTTRWSSHGGLASCEQRPRSLRGRCPVCTSHWCGRRGSPGPDQTGYCAVSLRSRISFAHLAISVLMYAPSSSGVVGEGSSPCTSSASRVSGSVSAR